MVQHGSVSKELGSMNESYLQDVEHRMFSRRVSLNKATQTMDTNPIKTAITVCSELIQKKARNKNKSGWRKPFKTRLVFISGLCNYRLKAESWRFVTSLSVVHGWLLPHSSHWDQFKGQRVL